MTEGEARSLPHKAAFRRAGKRTTWYVVDHIQDGVCVSDDEELTHPCGEYITHWRHFRYTELADAEVLG